MRFLPFAFLATLIVLGSSSARGQVICTYEGPNFSSIDAGTAFTTADRITGTATFAAEGDAASTSATFSVSSSGSPSLPYSLSGTPSGFTWSGGVPTGYFFTLTGNPVAGTAPEELQVSDFGDAAAIDATAVTPAHLGSTGFSSGSWTCTAVPEPSSFLCIVLVGVLFGARRYVNFMPGFLSGK